MHFGLFFVLYKCIPVFSYLQFPLSIISKKPQDEISDNIHLSDSYSLYLHWIYSSQYYINLKIGTPPREFSFQIDTQHPLTWISSTDCNCTSIYQYNKLESGSYVSLNSTTEINYEYGSVQGNLSKERFAIDSNNSTDFIFLLVNQQKNLSWMISEGIVGLGFSKKNEGYINIIDALKDQNFIKSSIFSIYMSKNEKESPSIITVGGYDAEDHTESEETIINIMNTGHWQSEINSIAIGNNSYNDSYSVFFNPGISVIIGPEEFINIIFDIIIKQANCSISQKLFLVCTFNTSNLTSLPILSFEINSNSYLINPESYVYQSESNLCILLLPHPKDYWIIGQPLFKEYFSVFDLNNSKILMFSIDDDSDLSLVIYFIVGIFVIIVIVVPILAYYFLISKKMKKLQDQEQLPELQLGLLSDLGDQK